MQGNECFIPTARRISTGSRIGGAVASDGRKGKVGAGNVAARLYEQEALCTSAFSLSSRSLTDDLLRVADLLHYRFDLHHDLCIRSPTHQARGQRPK